MSAHRDEVVMAAPDEGGIEGHDPERGFVDLHYVGWDSMNGDVRLWVGQYAGADDCAVTLRGPGDADVVLLCSRAQLTEWHEEVGRMLASADAAVMDADTAERAR